MESNLKFFFSKEAHKTYKANCGDGKVFSQMSDMYFWCVVLGYRKSPDKLPPQVDSFKRETWILWSTFDDEVQKPFMKMIAVEAANSFDIMKDETGEEGYDFFRSTLQNYAELGFTILNTKMGNKYTMDKLMGILIDQM